MVYPCLYISMIYLKINDNETIHSTKRSGDKLSPWKITLPISTLPKDTPLDVNSSFHLFMLFTRTSLVFSATPNTWRHSLNQLCGIISYDFQQSIQAIARFVLLLLQSLSTALSNNNWSSVPLLFLLQPFCSSGNIFSSSKRRYTCSEIMPVKSFHSYGKKDMGR